jgi:5-methylcytosine-specific restriction endonuclease McrA
VNRRGLYRDLGYASIHQYATDSLGFSRNRTFRFLRLAHDLDRLPHLRASLASGDIGWTKAREVVKVASPATEERWIHAARHSTRRELERKVARARLRAAAQRKADPLQGELPASTATHAAACSSPTASTASAACLSPTAHANPVADDSVTSDDILADDAPVAVVFRLTPIQLARYEALIECIRKSRVVASSVSREEILLRALDQLLRSAGDPAPADPASEESSTARGADIDTGDSVPRDNAPSDNTPRDNTPSNKAPGDRAPREGALGEGAVGSRQHEARAAAGTQDISQEQVASTPELPRGNCTSNYRVVIYKCASCGHAIVQTQHGPRQIAPDQLAAISCDAIVEHSGERSAATIPPSTRRAVLARDHHRCRAPGCDNTQFLEVHHIQPRDRGGSNRPENLVTLCSTCHHHWHARQLDGQPLERGPGLE